MIQSAFPYFGRKAKVAELVWSKFGNCKNFVDPFMGSNSILLACPLDPKPTMTVNDQDHLLVNFFRAVKNNPLGVAYWADGEVHEVELNMRHRWIKEKRTYIKDVVESGIESYDAKVAGWWVHGLCNFVGSGYCTPIKSDQKPYMSSAGQGITRIDTRDRIPEYLAELSSYFKRVRVLCGDWSRCVTTSCTTRHGLTAVFLDPPYEDDKITGTPLYTHEKKGVAQEALEWAIENGNSPLLRIAYCGYNSNSNIFPSDWTAINWKAGGGYANQSTGKDNNSHRETIWFSPHCVKEQNSECL